LYPHRQQLVPTDLTVTSWSCRSDHAQGPTDNQEWNETVTITEANRHRLHQALIEAVGEEEAANLMEHLPPIGWADVATKADLDHLQTVIEARFDTKVAELRTEMAVQFKETQRWQLTALACATTIITAILGVMITLT